METEPYSSAHPGPALLFNMDIDLKKKKQYRLKQFLNFSIYSDKIQILQN
jgi:hypothetical protein